MESPVRVIVVGGGVFGLAAARELAGRGHDVEVREAVAFPAPRAASHDVSKALRRAYGAETPRYAPLAVAARAQWRALEAATGASIYHEVGWLGLATRLAPGSFEYESAVALGAGDAPGEAGIEWLAPDAVRERWPGVALEGVEGAVFDPIAGWIDPMAAISALAKDARARGARLVSGVRVGVDDVGGEPGALTLVAAGAWVRRLLPDLPLAATPTLQVEALYAPRSAAPPLPFWSFDIAGEGFYGFGATGHGLFKVACHRPGPAIDPDAERAVPEADLAALDAFVRERLPFLAVPAREVRTCLYTMSPDGNFVFDAVPGRAGVFVAGLGSGHAFKFGPELGRIAADMVEGRPVPAQYRIAGRGAGRVV